MLVSPSKSPHPPCSWLWSLCFQLFHVAFQDTISGLQQRLEAIQAAVQRAERDRDMFTKVLRATERNIPNDPSHMARIDKVIMTVEAELVEAKTMEKVTEYELKHLLTQELPQLKVSYLNSCRRRTLLVLFLLKLVQSYQSVPVRIVRAAHPSLASMNFSKTCDACSHAMICCTFYPHG